MALNITKLKLRNILFKMLIRDGFLLIIGVISICVCFYLTYSYQYKLTYQLYPLDNLIHELNSTFKDDTSSFITWLDNPTLSKQNYSLQKKYSDRYQLLRQIELRSKNLPYKGLPYQIQKDTHKLYWEQWHLIEISSTNTKNVNQNMFLKRVAQTVKVARKNIEYIILSKDSNTYEKFFRLYDEINTLEYYLINNFYNENNYFSKKVLITLSNLEHTYNNIALSDQEKKIINKPIQDLIRISKKSLQVKNSYYDVIRSKLKEDYIPINNYLQKLIDELITANKIQIIYTNNVINILIFIEFGIIILILLLFILLGILNVKKIISFILKPIEYLSHNIDLATKGDSPTDSKTKNYIFEFNALVGDFEHMLKQRREHTNQLTYLAHHDKQTGIYNYSYLEELFDSMVNKLNTYKNDILVVYIKILKYDDICSILGEVAATHAITIFTKKLSQFENIPFLYAKIGEAKFLIASHLKTEDNIDAILAAFSNHAHYCLTAAKLSDFTKCIIGAVKYSEYPHKLPILLQYCKFVATHSVNHLAYHLFNKKSAMIFNRESTLGKDIRTAIENKQLFLQYQPQYALADHQLIGCEALIRWHHPKFGVIEPSEFIPLAEKSECILSIGRFVQQTAIADYASWFNDKISHKKITLAVNASIVELLSQDYDDHLLSLLNKYHISPNNIEVEITESMITLYLNDIKTIVKRLKESGITIAIDDFGTGYSSLERLLSFDFDLLKIDKSFIEKSFYDERSKKLLTSVISLASNIDIKTLAEGVETAEQVALLTSLNCDYVQGYYFSKPITSAEMKTLL